MVTLFCAIVGEAESAFPVDIDASLSVGDLKDAIKAKKPNDLKDVDADKLQLFLAKKGDRWLPDDDTLDAVLQSGDDTSYVKMRASWKLNKPSLFGPNVSLGEDVIHVLVVVPDGAGGSANETSTLAQMSAKIDDLHKQAIGKRKYVHSEVTSTQGRQLLNDLDIRVEFVRTVPFAAGEGSSVGPYEWKRVTIENGEEVVL
ncbi:hypothetical protein PC122_g12392, partial [Phytophthora cactorum]